MWPKAQDKRDDGRKETGVRRTCGYEVILRPLGQE